jgi:hypothetical protein
MQTLLHKAPLNSDTIYQIYAKASLHITFLFQENWSMIHRFGKIDW